MFDIIINGRNFKFDPYSVTWIQKRDYYAFTSFDGIRCFIKKYEKKKPSAWGLIMSLIGQVGKNIPAVYDAIEDKNTNTCYVFFEYIKGVTLKEYILNGDVISPNLVLIEIEKALSVIHSKGYWFSDFNEENIFITSGLLKKILLIDIDSCWQSSIAPNHISNEVGGIPGAAQNIGRHVLEFYSKYLNDSQNVIKYQDLPGRNFNYLQLLVLCVKLNIFQNRKLIENTFQYIHPANFKDLQKNIHDCDPDYSKGVFTLSKNANKNMRDPIIELINRILKKK